MNPATKAVGSALRALAAGLVILSLCLYSSDVFLYLSHRPASRPLALALKGAPLVAGIFLLCRAGRLAARWTAELD